MPVDVTVVDRTNHYTFQPLLYQVALAVLSPADIAQPIRSILSGNRNVEVLMDEVVGFDLESRRAFWEAARQLSYDYLILATGATHSYFGHDSWAAVCSRAQNDRETRSRFAAACFWPLSSRSGRWSRPASTRR